MPSHGLSVLADLVRNCCRRTPVAERAVEYPAPRIHRTEHRVSKPVARCSFSGRSRLHTSENRPISVRRARPFFASSFVAPTPRGTELTTRFQFVFNSNPLREKWISRRRSFWAYGATLLAPLLACLLACSLTLRRALEETHHTVSPINRQDTPRYIAGSIAGEEAKHPGNLFGLGHAPQRRPLQHL